MLEFAIRRSREDINVRPLPRASWCRMQTDIHQIYPCDELEWLATSAYDRAIDFYMANNDQLCRRWVASAVALAEQVDDGGMLVGLLRERSALLVADRP